MNLNDHILNQTPTANHLIQLTYLILYTYFRIRIHHKNNTRNEELLKKRVRHKLTKLIHFKNQ